MMSMQGVDILEKKKKRIIISKIQYPHQIKNRKEKKRKGEKGGRGKRSKFGQMILTNDEQGEVERRKLPKNIIKILQDPDQIKNRKEKKRKKKRRRERK